MLTAAIIFSIVAAGLVWLAGRNDVAHDPRLTLISLGLLAVFPLLFFLPSVQALPAGEFTSTPQSLSRWLPWIWGAGVLVASARLLTALSELHRWRKSSLHLELLGKIEIRLLSELAGPVAAGIMKPVIFVPAAWHRWPEETRTAVLAHELKHHQRKDPLWRAIGAAACTLHWFNPLAWWMARRLADQCEFACDEEVLAEGMQADRYANVLCDLAAAKDSPATALAMAHQSGLEARVKRIFSKSSKASRVMLVSWIVLTAFTALGLATIRRADPPSAPGVPMEEIQLRLNADPFPGN